MCDACVMRSVSNGLGRRGVLAALGLYAAAATVGPALAQPVRATRVADLTHTLRPTSRPSAATPPSRSSAR